MHHRRIASFLAGLWIAGSLFMMYVTSWNMRGVDSVLAAPTPEASKVIEKLGPETTRTLLRFHASEENRHYRIRWEQAQIVLCLVLAAVLYLGTHVNRLMVVLCGLMFLIVGFLHWVVTPELAFLGRDLDFSAANTGGMKRLRALEWLYYGLAALNLLLAGVIAGYLFVFKTRPKRTVEREAVLSQARS
jgi:hypothetical protein